MKFVKPFLFPIILVFPICFFYSSTVFAQVISDFTIFASDQITIKAGASVLSGFIGVNDDPSSSTTNLDIGSGVVLADGVSVFAPKINIGPRGSLGGDVYYRDGLKIGTNVSIAGDIIKRNNPDWPVIELPDIPTCITDNNNPINVPINRSGVLSPGNYGDVKVGSRGALVFDGGEYHLNSLEADINSKILFSSDTVICVENNFEVKSKSIFGPDTNSGNSSDSKIVVNVKGGDVNFGVNSTIFGNFIVPNGEISIGGRATAMGTFVARKVEVGINSKISKVSHGEGDISPPVIFNVFPGNGSIVSNSNPEISGEYSDSESGINLSSIVILFEGIDVSSQVVISEGKFVFKPDTLDDGLYQLEITVTDNAGNKASRQVNFEVDSKLVEVSIAFPGSGLITKDATIEVTGTISQFVDSVRVSDIEVDIEGLEFRHTLQLSEGNNTIVAVAESASGKIATDNVRVILDTKPATIVVESPQEGESIAVDTIDVVGSVNDIVTGTTINADDVTITVNNIEAQVVNRTFLLANLNLKPGPNIISVKATDRAGNISEENINVIRRNVVGQKIKSVSGNSQSSEILSRLPEPLVVELISSEGVPVVNRTVNFKVSKGDGLIGLTDDSEEKKRVLTIQTNEMGQAKVYFQLGQKMGAGNQRVSASANGFVGEVVFCATAQGAAPIRITPVSGKVQDGLLNQVLSNPFVALVTDKGGNPVQGVPVKFELIEGGGNFDNSQTSVAKLTDMDGQSIVSFRMGGEAGINNTVVQASFEELNERPAFFSISGKEIGKAEDTKISGTVLDTEDIPVAGVKIQIEGTELFAESDAEGRFVIDLAPVGPVRLLVDGSNVTRPGQWAPLKFDLVTLSGQNNTLGMPIYMLELDAENSKIVGGNQDVKLEMKNVPGAELTVFANSVTCPDESTECRVSFTQVNNEHMAMPPPLGSIAMLAWTVKPNDVRFDPPARICIPNGDMPPGQQVEMFSFDSDLADWVAIGPATVTEDGSQLCANTGFGIVKTGWGCCSPAPPPPTDIGGPGDGVGGEDEPCGENGNCDSDCLMCEDDVCIINPANMCEPGCIDANNSIVVNQPSDACQDPVVTFSLAEARPGVHSNRAVTLTATIFPNNVAIDFVSSDTRAKVSPSSGQGAVSLTIEGNSLSGANEDTYLQALINGQELSSIPITVVEPFDHTQQTNVVDTLPSASGSVLVWDLPLEITILDQFGIPLQNNWDGLPIQELVPGSGNGWTGFSSGQSNALLINGKIIDDVKAFFMTPIPQVAQNIVTCTQTLNGTSPSTRDQFIRANMDDGTNLMLTGKNIRTITINMPAKGATCVNSK